MGCFESVALLSRHRNPGSQASPTHSRRPDNAGSRTLGTLVTDSWFLADVEPGQYDMRCNAPESSDSEVVAITTDETRSIEVATLDLMLPHRAVLEVNAEQGQKAVLGGKRAQEIR